MYDTVAEFSDRIENGRTLSSIMLAVTAEVGELAEEVNIAEAMSYKKTGPDGIVGEAMDVVASVFDLVRKHNPEITQEELITILTTKCQKWEDKVNEHISS
jgi:NTP pyrophosphatase (non-canonical NTP hydrolase)